VDINLYLRRTGGHGWWILLYRSPLTGRRVEMSLGPVGLLTRTEVKQAVLRHRVALQEGRCPLSERKATQQARKAAHAHSLATAPVFRAAFGLYLQAHQSGWRNPKHRQQWANTLETYAFPVLADLPVDRIGVGAVQQVLQPIWLDKPETASRVRGRIEAVLDFAKANGWRPDGSENPARWRGHLDHLLPRGGRATRHHAALPWQELPALYQRLVGLSVGQADVAALALRYLMLTLLRSGEVLGAVPGEIDRATRTHVIPPERMKAGKEHRVPLTGQALRVLGEAEAIRTGPFVFSGARGGRLSDVALLKRLRGLCPDQRPTPTVHGMRSAFRDWTSEIGTAREHAERQLAHVVSNQVEAAYLRSDVLDPRRVLMARWEAFLLAPARARATDQGRVVPLTARPR
jgi:integrase